MFRVLDLLAGSAGATVESTESLERVAPPPPGTIRWIDLEKQDPGQLEILAKRFGFHPLAIEDCMNFDQRPKLEEYDGYLFIVVHGFTCEGDAREVEPHELHAFLGDGYLVTVHTDPIPPLEVVMKRIVGEPALGARGADYIYYQILDGLVDANFPILDTLSDALEAIEDAVLTRPNDKELANIFALKRTLVTMRRVLSPQRDVCAMLAKRGDPRISERTALYFRDVYDHLVRIYESIDTGRDLLGNALDAYLSMVANRTNEIMKRLTILSAIFLPLAFVTGFFGQNFDMLPWTKSWGLVIGMLITIVVIPVGMLFWFQRKKWL